MSAIGDDYTVSVQPPEVALDDFLIDVGGSMSDTPSQPPMTDQPLDEMSRQRVRRILWRSSGLSGAAYCRQIGSCLTAMVHARR